MAEVTLRITADTRGAVTGVQVVQRELGELGQAGRGAAESVGDVGDAAQRAGRQAEHGMGGAAAAVAGLRAQVLGLVAGAASIGTVLSVAGIADEYGQVSARLKAVIGDSMSLAAAQDAVFEVAQRTRSSLAATGDLVSGLARSYAAAGLSSQQAFATSLRLSEAINNALVTSGTSAAAASGLITQLGQALSSGVLRGDEFNSMMEASPRLAQALAAGLNVPIGKLREMAEAGDLTRERVTAALTGVEWDKLSREAAAMPLTLAQGWQQVTNAFQQYVGRANSELGATSSVAAALGSLAENMDAVIEGALRLTAVVGAGLGVRALLPLLAVLPAQLTALATGLLATATAATSAHAAFVLTATSMTALQMAAVGLATFFAGWQLGSYLNDQFVEARLAGIAFVEGSLVAFERLRAGVLVVWEAIKAAGTGALDFLRSNIADFLDEVAAAGNVEVFGTKLLGGAAEGVANLAAALRPGTSAAEGFADAAARINAEAETNIAVIRKTTGELADYEIAQDLAGRATGKTNAELAKTSPAAAAAAAKVAELRKAAEDAAKALDGITRSNAAAGWSELTRAAVGYGDQLTRLRQIELDLQAAGQLTVQRQAEIDAARDAGAESYRRAVDAQLTAQQRARAAVDGLIPQIQAETAALGLSAGERERLRARIDAEAEARRRLQAVIDAGGQSLGDAEAEAYIRAAGAAAEAGVAQRELAAASQQAAEDSARYWGGAGDAISSALGEGLVDGFKGTAERLKNIFKRLLADLATAAISQRIFIPIMTALGLPTGGMQSGGLLQTILGGGQPGGGGLLGSIGNALGLGGTGSGGVVRGVLGTVLGIGGGTALASGLGAIGAGGGAAGLGLAGLGGGAAGAGAFAGASAAGAAGLGFMSTIGAALPVIGQIAAIATIINSLAGGRLFGTSRRPDSATQTIGLSDAGGTASATMTTVRQRSLFRGREWDTQNVDAGDEATQAARQLFEAVRQTMVQAARQLEAEAPEMIAASLRTVQQFDKDGKVKATQYFVDILGRTWEEATAEAAAARINAEALIATIDAALGTTVEAGTQAATSAVGEVIGAAAGAIGDELGDNITTMLKGASGALQGEASAIAERWRNDANALMDGAQLLLAAATDIRRGAGLLGDGSLTAVVGLIEDLAAEGESLAQTYARVAGSTKLLEDALALSGITLNKTREEFVRFATNITEAAGGIDRANQLWSSYFNTFFTAEERALLAQQRARTAGEREFRDIGLNFADFTGPTGLADFRRQFDEVLRTGSAEAIVQWLEAAEALGIFTDATGRLGDRAIAQASNINEFMAGVDAGLAEGGADPGLAERLERQRAQNAEQIARATELGASEEQLARVRQLGDQRIQQIINSSSAQTQTLAGALRQLGIAAVGTAEEFAVAASGLSDDFGSLFEGFLGSFYSDAERAAMRQTVAQSNLTAALTAAGLSTDNVISRTELRIQIEAALAAGNYKLAESLLRVARAMNEVEQAAGGAAGSVGQLVDEYGRPVGGNSTIGGGGGGFDSSQGTQNGSNPFGVAGGLVDDIERIRQGLRDWLQSLTTGDLSPERPRDQLRRAQAELQRLATAAAGGDLEALRQLSGAGDAVLRLGRSVFGSSAAYTALFEQVRALVGNAAGITPTPIGGGTGPGGGGRPGDDLGDLGRSATNAAAALDMLAARAGMPAGSLSAGLPIVRPQWSISDQQVSETASRPVVQELQRGQQQQRNDADRLRAELAAMREEMAELRRAAQDQARELAKANDIRRV